MRNRKTPLVIVIIFTLTISTSSFLANAKSNLAQVTVAVGDSIQSAINNAQNGDTILIQNGIHIEESYPILVNKTVTLVGENVETTIIDGGGSITGIFLVKAYGAKISNLTIQNTTISVGIAGFHLSDVKNVEIVNSKIRNCSDGILLTNSTHNNITRNEITKNYASGIYLHDNSSFNVFTGNNISINPTGIQIADLASRNNRIYHNNFVNNTNQKGGVGIGGTWDNGYPSGGNYWSDYIGTDKKSGPGQDQPSSDGIGDMSYGGRDNYPFPAPLYFFNAGRWDNRDYSVMVASNSTVSDFNFDPDTGTFMKFNVTGLNGARGFFRATIPKQMLWVENGEQWVVLINGTSTNYLVLDDLDYTYLYFTFNYSTQIVEIWGTHVIPEWPIIGALAFMVISVCGEIIAKRKKLF